MKPMPTIYIDKDGDKISKQEWAELRKDRSYWQLSEYNNGQYHVIALWHGEIDTNISREHWAPFRLAVFRIFQHDADGLPLPDGQTREVPLVEYCMPCKTQFQLVEAYEDFLVRHCDCEWVPSPGGRGGGAHPDLHFIERNNLLSPSDADIAVKQEQHYGANFGSW